MSRNGRGHIIVTKNSMSDILLNNQHFQTVQKTKVTNFHLANTMLMSNLVKYDVKY